MLILPRPLSVPKRFEENSDLRGVGSCGLKFLAGYKMGANGCSTFGRCGNFETSRRQDLLLETTLVRA